MNSTKGGIVFNTFSFVFLSKYYSSLLLVGFFSPVFSPFTQFFIHYKYKYYYITIFYKLTKI